MPKKAPDTVESLLATLDELHRQHEEYRNKIAIQVNNYRDLMFRFKQDAETLSNNCRAQAQEIRDLDGKLKEVLGPDWRNYE